MALVAKNSQKNQKIAAIRREASRIQQKLFRRRRCRRNKYWHDESRARNHKAGVY